MRKFHAVSGGIIHQVLLRQREGGKMLVRAGVCDAYVHIRHESVLAEWAMRLMG